MKTKNDGLFQLIKEYLTIYLPKQKIASEHTIKSYRETLNLFITYISLQKDGTLAKVSLDDLTRENIENFLSWICEKRACGASTANQRLSAIRAFLKYASGKNILYVSCYTASRNIPLRKTEKKFIVMHFSESARDAMLLQPDPKKKNQHRDLFFLILLYDTGARDSEMLDMHPADIVTNCGAPYVVIRGKGKKIRTVPIMNETVQHFRSYCRRFGIDTYDKSAPLFYTMIHGEKCRMSDDNVARFIGKYADMARKSCAEVPKHVTPHMWRHSRAIHLYRKGVPLPLISEWLGHSNMETTLIYAYADTEMKRTAIEKATATNHPLYKQKETETTEGDNDNLRRYCGLK